ncbi:SIS domain-containing protein [Catenovulum sp. 2E275]|uniref:SIS domain-containing protein n=1 Tax=Catenovulum sp. 2E275 TaxID=2980497 RepID=UPI0021D34758|nr:SIS domain-containing protein [Catenovulum sp. 2E275]MCU4674738.1 SIS domain-containing protein [Catenovulum sp. 2E275]
MNNFSCPEYASQLSQALTSADWSQVTQLGQILQNAITENRALYICGNGGSAGNAQHLANDFLYGVSPKKAKSLRVEALSANCSVLTCLGNDLGYQHIFSRQIDVKGNVGDVLIVLSGSGNSANIVEAILAAKQKQMITVGILGYKGGKAKELVDLPIHFAIDDMQISEDLQLIVGHMLMRMLCDEGAC